LLSFEPGDPSSPPSVFKQKEVLKDYKIANISPYQPDVTKLLA
jgi:hypothetical protein